MKNITRSPLVSIIIPVYNSADYVEETIASISAQTYTNFEIIAIDDESTDNSIETLFRIAEKEKRLRPLRIPHSGSPALPRNHGIKASKGELIAFLDSDDLWTPDKLEKQIAYMHNHPDVGLLYSASVTFGNVSFFSPHFETLPLPFKASVSFDDLVQKGNSIPCSTVILRKAILAATGLFDEDPQKRGVEDYDLWIQISRITKIAFYPAIQCYYRIHQGQISSDWETRAKRVQYIAASRNLPLRGYSLRRNKGPLMLFVRNLIQLASAAYYKLTNLLR